ncbi:hypothetical protein CROQUDRAFT_673405 [Cronartium quercuum f. sp. fusiforme G11]|uniref:Uncharacterized protein n=1 Tax=Cronartium quercuum f. sp. fusiforme G11 TaxID=708437 RepID=A0A9P6T859_9BASI|nr:hypothetical protein CROQUDRAFT_673405 [Cronartium quercuum f. sp. fusiforme G11]
MSLFGSNLQWVLLVFSMFLLVCVYTRPLIQDDLSSGTHSQQFLDGSESSTLTEDATIPILMNQQQQTLSKARHHSQQALLKRQVGTTITKVDRNAFGTVTTTTYTPPGGNNINRNLPPNNFGNTNMFGNTNTFGNNGNSNPFGNLGGPPRPPGPPPQRPLFL